MPRAPKASASPPAKKPAAKRPAAKKASTAAGDAAPAKEAAPAKKAAAKPKASAAKVTTKSFTGGNGAAATGPSPYDDKFLAAQRTLLHTERKRLSHDADTLTAEADELAMLREPGDVQFDEESGEGDTLAVERERDLALSAQFRSQIEDIDRALAKIDEGTYGVCEVSGQPIPKERLRAIPWARERVEYKVGGFQRR
jgi:RNA polymerase-binding transcription factor DksA